VWLAHPTYKDPDEWRYVLSRLRPRHGHVSVNTKLLGESDYPRSWHELATDPKYQGNIVYLDPTATTGSSVIFVMNGYVGKSMTAADFWGLFAGQDPLLFGQTRSEYSAVAQGQRAVCLNATDETVLNLLQAGAPVKNLYFADTPYPAQTAEMGVLKTAQHPNAGLVFINWYLSKDGQDAISQIQSQNAIRRDVQSYVPEILKGQVVGAGTRGKIMVEKPLQTKLGSDVQSSGLFKLVVDRQPVNEFVSGWESFIKNWEATHGGPQDQPIFLQA
jgi:ABC-type Fe3+ transport system substrate-binding protein